MPDSHTADQSGLSGTAVDALPSGDRKRILIVDDSEDAAEALGEILQELGHTVQTAQDGPAALALLQGFTPDFAFLDIGLPLMDGYELARHIRADSRLVATRLVAITGYGRAEDEARSRAAGFDVHLIKPLDVDAICRLVVGDGGDRCPRIEG